MSVGQKVKEGTAEAWPFAARSPDGIVWEGVDLRPMIGTVLPSHLLRIREEWLMLAPSSTHTVVFASHDGVDWERLTTLDFNVQRAASTAYGAVVAGGRGAGLMAESLTAATLDGRTWSTTTLSPAFHSLFGVQAMFTQGDRAVLVVSESVDGLPQNRRLRLLSSVDGVNWRSAPTPPCFAPSVSSAAAAAVPGRWAIVTEGESSVLALSTDAGASWSCTSLRGAVFESQPSWGPPYVTAIADVRGEVALVGGRVIEPGAKGNWAAAVWYPNLS